MTNLHIISDINQFIAKKHTLDSETVEFLGGIKLQLLEFQEKSFEIHSKKQKTVSKEVDVLLRSIGKSTFINCYHVFKAKYLEEIKRPILEEMYNLGGAKSDGSARTKASIGLKIFKLDLNIEALESIIKSEKVEKSIIEKAKTILMKEIASNKDPK